MGKIVDGIVDICAALAGVLLGAVHTICLGVLYVACVCFAIILTPVVYVIKLIRSIGE